MTKSATRSLAIALATMLNIGCSSSDSSGTKPPVVSDPIVPSSITASMGYSVDGVTVSWTPSSAQDSSSATYRVFRRSGMGGDDQTLATTTDLFHVDKTVEDNVEYQYSVSTCFGERCSEKSDIVMGSWSRASIETVPLVNDLTMDREGQRYDYIGSCPEGVMCKLVASEGGVANLWPVDSVIRVGFIFDKSSMSQFREKGFSRICNSNDSDIACRSKVQTQVLEWANEWSNHGAISFRYSNSSSSEITISFNSGRSWSKMGVRSRNFKPSMNFGWLDKSVVLHEFGHALGFDHEHRRPDVPFIYNRASVVEDLMSQKWTMAQVEHNVLNKFNVNSTGMFLSEEFDKNSIMIYQMPRRWIQNQEECTTDASNNWCIEKNTELSTVDKASMAVLYPNEADRKLPWTRSHEISSGHGQIWGSWRNAEYCNEGDYAIGFRIRVEGSQGSGDDTAANAVQLYCKGPKEADSPYLISSHDGRWGSWSAPKLCTGGNYMKGFAIRTEVARGRGDDTAMNDFNGYCHSKFGDTLLTGNGGPWGVWGEKKSCPDRDDRVCGIRSKFEDHVDNGDDTALNDVLLYCCR